jgi:hypothetical protein
MTVLQAIRTKYIGPSNVKGSRVAAYAQAGRRYFDWDDSLNPDENHILAARLYAQRLEWKGKLVTGVLPDGSYAHVFAERSK